jgi:hypothetical protein
MKIGDKVRFLDAVGGGIVKSFQGKDVVLVEEEDGFETPVLAHKCIVIDTNPTTNVAKVAVAVSTPVSVNSNAVVKEQKAIPVEQPVVEKAGGDRLNIYLAYLPMDIKALGKNRL